MHHPPRVDCASSPRRLGGPRRRGLLGAALLFVLAASGAPAGCATPRIQGTSLDDTPENRVIVDFVERYRAAVESRDVETLKGLASRHYYENAATTHTSHDDWGRPDLDAVLERFRDHVKAINYELRITDVRVVGNRADVDCEQTWAFQYTDGDRDAWTKKSDMNRLELIKEGEGWRILSGM